MGAVLVALLLAQEPDLFGGDEPSPADEPPPRPKPDDGPLVIPPADGPVPDSVPKGEDAPPLKPPVPRPKDQERYMLQLERQHLLEAMPNYLSPTAVSTIGGLMFLIGGVFAALGGPAALQGKVDITFVVGVPMGLVGLGALVFGLMWVRERSLDREPFWERIHQIEEELGW